MKKFLLILILLTNICYAAVIDNLPKLESAACTFSQQKILPYKTLVSGGDFQFIQGKGVIFDTKYPIQIRSTYADNKQVNEIILAISQKNYSYIEKNFNIESAKSDNWHIVLTPKTKSIKDHLNSITIDGETYINKILINTVNNGKTNISFTNCRKI